MSIIENRSFLAASQKQRDKLVDHFVCKGATEGPPVVLEICGALKTKLLQKSAEVLFRHYAGLTGSSRYKAGIHNTGGIRLSWQEIDLAGLAVRGSELQSGRTSAVKAGNSDFGNPALLSFVLTALGPTRHQLVFRSTHAPLNGPARSFFLQMLFALYEMGDDYDMSSLSAALLEYFTRDRGQERRFWREMLKGVEQPAYLAIQEQPTSVPYEHFVMDIPARLYETVRTFARRNLLPFEIVLQGSWGILLSRLTSNSDVVFGTTVCASSWLPSITTFNNLLNTIVPLRMRCHPLDHCRDLFAQLQDDHWRIAQHRSLTMADIEEETGFGRLFTSIVFQKLSREDPGTVSGDSLSVTRLLADYEWDQNAALWLIVEQSEQARVRVQYAPDLFGRGTAELLVENWKGILEEVATEPGRRIVEIRILSQAERREEWNQTEREIGDKTIAELLKEPVEMTRETIA